MSKPAPARRPRRRARLVVRIYLFSLATMALTVAVTIAMARLLADEPGDPRGRMARDLDFIARHLDDPPAVQRELRRIALRGGPTITVFDAERRPLVSAGELPARPLPADALVMGGRDAPQPGPGPRPMVHVVERDGHAVGYVQFGPPRRRREPDGPSLPPVIALVVVGVLLIGGSLWFARHLVSPLQRIEATAIAFGRGEHDARARLASTDEIGAVGRALDDMADRVTALMASQRELMANVSHELRTPLASIRVAMDLAVEGNADTAREVITEIDADLVEIERLIDDLTTSARLDLGRATGATLRLEEIELGELVARSADRFRALHDSHPLTVDVDPALVVFGEPGLLRRALDNLIDNARKYSAPGQPIAVTARRDGTRAHLEVADRGVGIGPDDLPHVFAPFFRGDKSRDRSTGGVGLGLALARKIVQAHNGTIDLTSRLGEGTRVTIDLPAAPL